MDILKNLSNQTTREDLDRVSNIQIREIVRNLGIEVMEMEPKEISITGIISELHRRDPTMGDLLITAATIGNVDEVNRLLDEGTDIEYGDPINGSTALMFASQQSHGSSNLETVNLLLDRGANIDARNLKGTTALTFAIRATIPQMLNYARYKPTSSEETVKLLLDRGADLYSQMDLLFTAVSLGANINTLRIILDLDHDKRLLNYRDINGLTILMSLMRYSMNNSERYDIFRLLLEYGADVNIPDNRGKTALFYAAFHDKLQFIDELLEAGADVNIVDSRGNTVLYAVVILGKQVEYIDKLLAGADLRLTPNIIYQAIKQTYTLDLIKRLLDLGANPFIQPIGCSDECEWLLSEYQWYRVQQNIERLSKQYSVSGNFQLPREVWELILLRNRLQTYCDDLASPKNIKILMRLSLYLDLPFDDLPIDKSKLCSLISKQLSYGSKYSEKSVEYFTVKENREKVFQMAMALGIDPNQSFDNILDQLSSRLRI